MLTALKKDSFYEKNIICHQDLTSCLSTADLSQPARGLVTGYYSVSSPGTSTSTPGFLVVTLMGKIIVLLYLLLYYRAKNRLNEL